MDQSIDEPASPPEVTASHSDARRTTTAAGVRQDGDAAPEARRPHLMEPSEQMLSFVGEEDGTIWGTSEMDDSELQVTATVPSIRFSLEDKDAPAYEPVVLSESLDADGGHTLKGKEGSLEMDIAPHLSSPSADVDGEAPTLETAAPAAAPVISASDGALGEDVEKNIKSEKLEEESAYRRKVRVRRKSAAADAARADTVDMYTEKKGERAEDTDRKRRGRHTRKLSTIGGSPIADNGGVGGAVSMEIYKEDMEKSEIDTAQRGRGRRRRNPAASGSLLRVAGADTVGMDMEESAKDSVRGRRRGSGRKRGRPPKGQAAGLPTKRRKEKENEYVCFICFDGGDLVVCERRDCPKVYHPSCVNRDEAFFRAKGQWNCGWHICSNCEKSARYMCYTCTFSLCKGCVNEGGFVRVRGDKGFCVTCMSTVMMIESDEDGTKKPGGIDFDDKASWMYLFKDYWLDLKGKLSLNIEELIRVKTPVKESNALSRNESSDDQYDTNVVPEPSDSSSGNFEEIISARNKAKKQPRNSTNEENSVREAESEAMSGSEDIGWASKELMECVEHMKNGDRSPLSQFDVQALLLDYIKRHNLRDPCRKSDILCDSVLQNLFGKTRVGHFEMLKLLESHLLTKEPSPVVTDENQGGVVDPDPDKKNIKGNSDGSTRMSSDRKQKSRKELQEKEPQTNLDDYAAIDVHNVSLMYLQRNLMEDLLDDIDTFYDMVVGSFVRIRISGAGQRQDVYRLVKVVGLGKTSKKYKTGKKTTDFTLEILNLNKTEFITIDIISNQDFSEEECKCLRQSIKCGFIGRLNVGEVQEKARVLHAVRVNDWMESEKLRLGNLRDRTSERGHRKPLRDCVEKLQVLSTPEEHMQSLNEVPEIHADPKMDPDYDSSEDEEKKECKRQDNYGHSRESFILGKGSEGTSLGKVDSISTNNWSSAQKSVPTAWENRNTQTAVSRDVSSSTGVSSRKYELSLNQGKEVQQANSLAPLNAQVIANNLEVGASNNDQLVINPGQSSALPSETTSSPLPGIVASCNESEKMWHYQDPSGKVQGPFSMTQLRKWNTTGRFPASLRIWRASQRQEDSILLTDALIGKFQKELLEVKSQCNSAAHPAKVATVDNSMNSNDGGCRRNDSTTWADNHNAENLIAGRNDGCFSASSNKESVRTYTWAGQPSAWSCKSEAPSQKGRSEGWKSSNNNNSWPRSSQGPNSLRQMTPFSGSRYRPPSHQRRGGRDGCNGGQDLCHKNPNKTRGPGGQDYERQHPNWSRQTSVGNWNNQPVTNTSNHLRNDSFNQPTLQQSSLGWTGVQGAFISSSPLIAPGHAIGSGWGTKPRSEAGVPLTATKDSNIGAQATNPVGGWNSGSSLVLTQTVTAVGGSSYLNASVPNPATIAETADSVQFLPKKDGLGFFQVPNEQRKSCGSSGLSNNQSLGSACPIQNPRCDQRAGDVLIPSNSTDSQDLSVALCNDLGQNKNSSEANGRSVAENKYISVDGNLMNPSTGTSNTESNSKANTVSYEACQPSVIQHCGPKDIKPLVVSDAKEPVSDQILEASPMKQGPGDHSIIPASAANVCESIQCIRPEPSFSVPVLVGSGNLEAPPGTKSSEIMPSLTSADSTASRNVHVSSNVGSQQPSSLWKMSTNTELAQSSNSGVGVVPQNPSMGAGSSHANSNMSWGMTIQGSANIGYGIVTQRNNNVVWGIPSQGNPNLTIGWGMPSQTNANTSAGWGTGVQGNVNAAWGTQAQNANINAGWTTPAQGNTSANISWGAPAQGTANPTAGYASPTQVSMNRNIGWGTPLQSNTNAHAGQENTKQTWSSNVALGTLAQNANTNAGGRQCGFGDSGTELKPGTEVHGDVNLALRAPAQNANTNAGWTTPAQGNTVANLSWGAAAQVTANTTAGYAVPAQVSTKQNIVWGTRLQGNTNAHGGWVAGQGNMDESWNSNSLRTCQNQTTDRHFDQGGTSFTSSNSAHGSGRQPWSRMQSDGGEMSSRPSREESGVCKFHESGHYKKGERCNYIHL